MKQGAIFTTISAAHKHSPTQLSHRRLPQQLAGQPPSSCSRVWLSHLHEGEGREDGGPGGASLQSRHTPKASGGIDFLWLMSWSQVSCCHDTRSADMETRAHASTAPEHNADTKRLTAGPTQPLFFLPAGLRPSNQAPLVPLTWNPQAFQRGPQVEGQTQVGHREAMELQRNVSSSGLSKDTAGGDRKRPKSQLWLEKKN